MSIDIQWLDDLEQKVNAILDTDWKIDTLKRYRECGLAIIESGYLQQKHGSRDAVRIAIYSRLHIKETIFYVMLNLGQMSEDQFLTDCGKMKSLYEWRQKEKKALPLETLESYAWKEFSTSSIKELDKFLDALRTIYNFLDNRVHHRHEPTKAMQNMLAVWIPLIEGIRKGKE